METYIRLTLYIAVLKENCDENNENCAVSMLFISFYLDNFISPNRSIDKTQNLYAATVSPLFSGGFRVLPTGPFTDVFAKNDFYLSVCLIVDTWEDATYTISLQASLTAVVSLEHFIYVFFTATILIRL